MKLPAILTPTTFGFDILSFKHKIPGTFSSKYTDFLFNSSFHFCVSKNCVRLDLLPGQDLVMAYQTVLDRAGYKTVFFDRGCAVEYQGSLRESESLQLLLSVQVYVGY